MRWAVLGLCLLCLPGCAVQSADSPEARADDYYCLSFASLWQIQRGQLVSYQAGDREVVGVIAQVVREPAGLMVDPIGRIQIDPIEWVKIWIYENPRYHRYLVTEENLRHLRQLLPKE